MIRKLPTTQELVAEIERRRKRANQTLQEYCAARDTSHKTVLHWRSGARSPSLRTARKLLDLDDGAAA